MSLRQLGSVFRTGPAAGPRHLLILSNYLGAGITPGGFSGSRVVLKPSHEGWGGGELPCRPL